MSETTQTTVKLLLQTQPIPIILKNSPTHNNCSRSSSEKVVFTSLTYTCDLDLVFQDGRSSTSIVCSIDGEWNVKTNYIDGNDHFDSMTVLLNLWDYFKNGCVCKNLNKILRAF